MNKRNKLIAVALTGLALLIPVFISDRAFISPSGRYLAYRPTEEARTLNVRFISDPYGANILINGDIIGQAYFETELAAGTYQIEFQLSGFKSAPQTVTIADENQVIFQKLAPEAALMEIESSPDDIVWHMEASALYFRSSTTENYTILDLDSGEKFLAERLPDSEILTDAALRDKLHIPDTPDSIFATAYRSPSGRYIAYVPSNDQPEMALYDTQEDRVLETEVPLPQHSPVDAPAFKIRWSPNEEFAWVVRRDVYANCFFITIRDANVNTACTGRFNEVGSGEMVALDSILTAPSDSGFVLVYGILASDPQPYAQTWLVDINTLEGRALPFQNVLGASFLDDEHIYLALPDGIFSVSVFDFEAVEQISDLAFGQMRTRSVIFSPDNRYAIISADRAELMTTYWVYQLPE